METSGIKGSSAHTKHWVKVKEKPAAGREGGRALGRRRSAQGVWLLFNLLFNPAGTGTEDEHTRESRDPDPVCEADSAAENAAMTVENAAVVMKRADDVMGQ